MRNSMNKSIIGLMTATLILTSCGKDNKVVTTPNENSNANAFTTGVLAQGGMPKTKDVVSFHEKVSQNDGRGYRCSYLVDTSIMVTKSENNRVSMRIKKSGETTGRNAYRCPYTPRSMNEMRRLNITQQDFINQVTKKINRVLNPSVFCAEKKDRCVSFRLIQKKEVTKYGIPSVFVEAEFQYRNGRIFNSKSYISKVSLLQNVYEHSMTNVRTGQRVSFKSLKPNRNRRRPRR